MSDHPRPRATLTSRAIGALLATTALVAACTTTTPSPSPAPTPTATPAPVVTQPPATPAPTGTARPLAEVYAEIRTQVEGIRGLQPTDSVDPVVIDATQLATNLTKEFDSAHTAAQLKDAEDELITLGLLPAGTSLRKITLDFQGGQVAGYYSPDKNELYVVSRSGEVGPADEVTYAHEFTHQLQDQHFDLDKLGIDVTDQGDRSLARLGLVEGDAVSAQTTWMTQNLDSTEMGEVLKAALDPDAMAAFNNAPPYLRETALFPYQEGAAFVLNLINSGGYAAVNAVFSKPPDSTEQILHPEKYAADEAPIKVTIPAGVTKKLGAGWSEVGQDTLGEEVIKIWLNLGGVTVIDATKAAAGWGGDRLALYRGPDGATIVVLITAWDSIGDAEEFAGQAGSVADPTHRGMSISESGAWVAIALSSAGAESKLDAALDFDLTKVAGG